MKVAFVHYHLRTGGVTRVLLDQIESLRGEADTMVITGEAPARTLASPWSCIPSLAYDRDRTASVDAEATARAIVAAVRRIWPEGASLYHLHNPTLGKNRDLVAVIRSLQRMGEAVLLQVHDFAEDGRPDLYSDAPYPADCHYAVINRRDFRSLLPCGLREEGLHYIPNAVRPLPQDDTQARASLFLYPVRAIRRKNIGEAILLSLFLPAGCELAVTLEPSGPLDRRSYEDWRAFAASERLPVRFGIGEGATLRSLLPQTRAVVTTSVKEGFGFAFLEPWTAGKALFGRFLEETCPDFVLSGLRLDHLYRGIRLPLAWVDANRLARKWRRCAEARASAYGIAADLDSHPFVDPQGFVDFGALSEDLQRQALGSILASPRHRRELLDGNPTLETMFHGSMEAGLIDANRRAVLQQYSLEATGARLREIYGQVLARSVEQSVDKATLVRQFNAHGVGSLLLCPGSYD